MRALLPLALLAATPAAAETRGQTWWHHVEILAADDMHGRAIGSPDYDRAAAYVIAQFQKAGLQPAGTQGWKQPVDFIRQTIDQQASRIVLHTATGDTPLILGDDLTLSPRGGPAPTAVDAPLVFAGYGLRIPEAGRDDFAGLDVRGKIVVVVPGGPSDIAGPLKSNARSERARFLAQAGALGIMTIVTPGQVEIPWARARLLGGQPALYLADAGLRDIDRQFLTIALDNARAERLFAGSGHSFAAVAALADAAKPVPTFALTSALRATIAATRMPVPSYNIVGRLPGTDARLKAETVVLSAHLDHLGLGAPIAGDNLYNGAMDNASGVANLIEIARKLRADRARPRRTILFTAVTGEEQGLLGAHAFAERPPVPRASIVADLNFDMPLPLWPLKSVIVLGVDESSLGPQARAVAAARSLPVVADPLPDRNSFTRSDQYSFIRAGVPAIAFKFGFARGTPEEAIERTWRANRYHSPADDPSQPVEKEEAVKLNDYVAALALTVANDPARPAWNGDSAFRRFVR